MAVKKSEMIGWIILSILILSVLVLLIFASPKTQNLIPISIEDKNNGILLNQDITIVFEVVPSKYAELKYTALPLFNNGSHFKLSEFCRITHIMFTDDKVIECVVDNESYPIGFLINKNEETNFIPLIWEVWKAE